MNIVQQFEQVQAMLRDMAPLLASYRDKLIENGFTRVEAMNLVADFQRSMIK